MFEKLRTVSMGAAHPTGRIESSFGLMITGCICRMGSAHQGKTLTQSLVRILEKIRIFSMGAAHPTGRTESALGLMITGCMGRMGSAH